MRDIKIRALSKNRQTWLYVTIPHGWLNGYTVASYDWETMGQYTGLKDRSSVDIYEADIVKTNAGGIRVVEWDQTAFWLKDTDMPLYEHHELCQVIGNVHQNQELLK